MADRKSGEDIPNDLPNREQPSKTIPDTLPGKDNPVNPQDDEIRGC